MNIYNLKRCSKLSSYFNKCVLNFVAMDEHELLSSIALTQCEGVGDQLAKGLISYCGSASQVFKTKVSELAKVPGIGDYVSRKIKQFSNFDFAEKELKFISEKKVTPILFHQANYPKRLTHCYDSPFILYKLGDADLNPEKTLGIVGTRKSTNYGKLFTESLVEALQPLGVQIISGLALGIDGHAHKASIHNNLSTIGVLGHGLDIVYPATHTHLADQILKHNGALLSENPSGTIPDKQNFPRRNRIVAGMCDALLVVESDIRGGALITATIAHSYNRDVFALPGRNTDKYSSGCNLLIKANKAAMIETADDIMFNMGWKTENKSKKRQPELLPELSEDELIVFNLLKVGEKNIDDLTYFSNITPGKLSVLLLNLELKGVISSLPGKRFALI